MMRVVSVHQATTPSGVTSAGAALASMCLPGYCVIPLAVGPQSRLGSADAHPLASVPGALLATWPDDASPLQAMLSIRAALLKAQAGIVLPHDCTLAYVAAASLHHSRAGSLRCGLWHHSNGWDGDDVAMAVAPLADAWAAVSSELTRRVAQFTVRTSTLTVPMPVPVQLASGPAPWLPNTRTLRLLYAARLERRHKRCLDLAALADQLHERAVRFRLTIAGDGTARQALFDAMYPHILAGRVEFIGVVPPSLMPALHAAHDLTLLVSEREGMPLAVAQSMAVGRAVAITRGCGAAVETLTDGVDGVITETADMHALADRLADLATDRALLIGMGTAAYATAARHWSFERLQPRILSFLDQLSTANAFPSFGNVSQPPAERWRHMVQALDSVGPTPPQSLAPWRSEWLAEQDIPTSELCNFPLVLPPLRLSAQARLEEALEVLSACGHTRPALAGAGAHTRRLLDKCPALLRTLLILDDDHAARVRLANHGEHSFPQGRIISFDAAATDTLLRPDSVIISSDEWEEPLAERTAQVFGERFPIYRLYSASLNLRKAA